MKKLLLSVFIFSTFLFLSAFVFQKEVSATFACWSDVGSLSLTAGNTTYFNFRAGVGGRYISNGICSGCALNSSPYSNYSSYVGGYSDNTGFMSCSWTGSLGGSSPNYWWQYGCTAANPAYQFSAVSGTIRWTTWRPSCPNAGSNGPCEPCGNTGANYPVTVNYTVYCNPNYILNNTCHYASGQSCGPQYRSTQCGETTSGCSAVYPAAQTCASCHTNNYYTYDGTSCSQTRYCAANAPAYQACPTYCGYTGGYLSDGNCGSHYCSPINPPAAQSCPNSCHIDYQYVPNGSCGGYTTCPPNQPAAQSCPTYCGYPGGYVYNGTSCSPTVYCSAVNPTPAQSCPTTCHTTNVLVPNGTCGGYTTCYANAASFEQSCPTSCHVTAVYVNDASCGQTKYCAPNATGAQSCPLTCHVLPVTVPDGTCGGSTTCPGNATAYQACPTYCGYVGGYLSDGNCGTHYCSPVNPPAAQSCPTTCHLTDVYVNNGTCGGYTTCYANAASFEQACPTTCHVGTIYVNDAVCTQTKACPGNAPPAGTCPTYCGYPGSNNTIPNGVCGYLTCPPINATAYQSCPTNCDFPGGNLPDGTCGGTHYCPPVLAINDAGVVQSTSTIDPGPSGNISQGGCYPGYRTPNYTSVTDVVSVSYPNLLNTVLKNAGFNTTAALDATGCSLGITIPTPNFNIYCYLVNIAGNFDTKLAAAIGDTTAGKTMILYPINNATGSQTVSTLENVPNNRKVIVFVNGDLLVNNNVLISAGNTGSGVVFVINGNLTTNAAVVNLDGVYIFSGSFDDGASSTAITGRGSLLATGVNNILFNRSTATNVTSAEHWIYEPKYLVLFNQALAIPKYTWQELPPQ